MGLLAYGRKETTACLSDIRESAARVTSHRGSAPSHFFSFRIFAVHVLPVAQEVCAKIDAVTADDLMTVARRALATPPSLSVVGSDLEGVPTHDQVCSWFSSPPLEAEMKAGRGSRQ